MARMNQFAGRSPQHKARRHENQAARRESLEARGVNVGSLMTELGVGERKACAEAERRLGLRWCDGRSFGQTAGHSAGNHRE